MHSKHLRLIARIGLDGRLQWREGEGEWIDWRHPRLDLIPQKRIMKEAKERKLAEARRRVDKDGRPDLGDYCALVEDLYKPQINLRTQQLEINGAPLKEEDFEHLHAHAKEQHGLAFRKADMQSAIRSVACHAEYDPVKIELDSFARSADEALNDEEWAQLAYLCFGLEGEFAGEVLRKFLISSVARVYKPGCKVDQALILYGAQGLGKSTFFKILGGDYFSDSLGDLSRGKDDLQVLHRCWIAEWGEVDQVFAGAQKAEQVKRFVSAQRDDFRPPYGRNVRAHERRCVIVGSTNRDDWATDPTGNRRYPILQPKTINGGWTEENRARMLGRAVAEFRKGTPWWYDQEGEAEITRRATAFAPEDPDKDEIFEFLKGRAGQAFSSKELWVLALAKPAELFDGKIARRVARSCRALFARGCEGERRWHLPSNASCGGGSECAVWWHPPIPSQLAKV